MVHKGLAHLGRVEWIVLRGLPEEDRRRMLAAARRRTFGRREVLFHEGDPGDSIHLIGRGRVAVRITTPRGDVATIAVLGSGDIVGELALMWDQIERSATVVALEPTETLVLRRTAVDELRRAHAAVDRFFIELFVQRLRQVNSLLVEALFIPAETRVVRRLLAVAQLYGEVKQGSVVPLTQEDLASLAGTSRETVNRVLRAAEHAGTVSLARSRIQLLDPAALQSRAARY
jgi:CRP/FNR family cyclic AMP-dependent transcriptional regulator